MAPGPEASHPVSTFKLVVAVGLIFFMGATLLATAASAATAAMGGNNDEQQDASTKTKTKDESRRHRHSRRLSQKQYKSAISTTDTDLDEPKHTPKLSTESADKSDRRNSIKTIEDISKPSICREVEKELGYITRLDAAQRTTMEKKIREETERERHLIRETKEEIRRLQEWHQDMPRPHSPFVISSSTDARPLSSPSPVDSAHRISEKLRQKTIPKGSFVDERVRRHQTARKTLARPTKRHPSRPVSTGNETEDSLVLREVISKDKLRNSLIRDESKGFEGDADVVSVNTSLQKELPTEGKRDSALASVDELRRTAMSQRSRPRMSLLPKSRANKCMLVGTSTDPPSSFMARLPRTERNAPQGQSLGTSSDTCMTQVIARIPTSDLSETYFSRSVWEEKSELINTSQAESNLELESALMKTEATETNDETEFFSEESESEDSEDTEEQEEDDDDDKIENLIKKAESRSSPVRKDLQLKQDKLQNQTNISVENLKSKEITPKKTVTGSFLSERKIQHKSLSSEKVIVEVTDKKETLSRVTKEASDRDAIQSVKSVEQKADELQHPKVEILHQEETEKLSSEKSVPQKLSTLEDCNRLRNIQPVSEIMNVMVEEATEESDPSTVAIEKLSDNLRAPERQKATEVKTGLYDSGPLVQNAKRSWRDLLKDSNENLLNDKKQVDSESLKETSNIRKVDNKQREFDSEKNKNNTDKTINILEVFDGSNEKKELQIKGKEETKADSEREKSVSEKVYDEKSENKEEQKSQQTEEYAKDFEDTSIEVSRRDIEIEESSEEDGLLPEPETKNDDESYKKKKREEYTTPEIINETISERAEKIKERVIQYYLNKERERSKHLEEKRRTKRSLKRDNEIKENVEVSQIPKIERKRGERKGKDSREGNKKEIKEEKQKKEEDREKFLDVKESLLMSLERILRESLREKRISTEEEDKAYVIGDTTIEHDPSLRIKIDNYHMEGHTELSEDERGESASKEKVPLKENRRKQIRDGARDQAGASGTTTTKSVRKDVMNLDEDLSELSKDLDAVVRPHGRSSCRASSRGRARTPTTCLARSGDERGRSSDDHSRSPERYPERSPERSSERYPQRSPQRSPQRFLERFPERSPERSFDDVGQSGDDSRRVSARSSRYQSGRSSSRASDRFCQRPAKRSFAPARSRDSSLEPSQPRQRRRRVDEVSPPPRSNRHHCWPEGNASRDQSYEHSDSSKGDRIAPGKVTPTLSAARTLLRSTRIKMQTRAERAAAMRAAQAKAAAASRAAARAAAARSKAKPARATALGRASGLGRATGTVRATGGRGEATATATATAKETRSRVSFGSTVRTPTTPGTITPGAATGCALKGATATPGEGVGWERGEERKSSAGKVRPPQPTSSRHSNAEQKSQRPLSKKERSHSQIRFKSSKTNVEEKRTGPANPNSLLELVAAAHTHATAAATAAAFAAVDLAAEKEAKAAAAVSAAAAANK